MKNLKYFTFNYQNNNSIFNELVFIYAQFFARKMYSMYLDGLFSDNLAYIAAYFHYLYILLTIDHKATYFFVNFSQLNNKLNK